MDQDKIRSKFIKYFEKNGHLYVVSSSLLPEDDSSVLLTTAGMQQFKPYMAGIKNVFKDKHLTTEKPLGNERLCSIQKSFRTTDIDEVGDRTHLTFFEMLGNFSIGDYFKKEAAKFAWELLTKELKIPADKLWVTVFQGEGVVPKDTETIGIWKSLGVPENKIFQFGRSDNFWGPTGDSGPCGPCSEIHYDFGEELSCGPKCGPNCSCGRFLEIWNLVFMEFFQDKDGKLTPLKQKNIDTGMGLERITRVLQNKKSIFDTDLFLKMISILEELSLKKYGEDNQTDRNFRIVLDHSRGATFLIADGVRPSNKEQGYILRRILRRAIMAGRVLGLHKGWISAVSGVAVKEYKEYYPNLEKNEQEILEVVTGEEEKFIKMLKGVTTQFDKFVFTQEKPKGGKLNFSATNAFKLYETYGIPYEIAKEEAEKRTIGFPSYNDFEKEMEKHKELSRKSIEKKFKTAEIAPAHTAAHLLNQALKVLLNSDIHQKGQKIGVGEFRHDFNFERKLTDKELKELEGLVNKKIVENLPVVCVETTLEGAKKEGAEAVFVEKYKSADKVTMYKIGDFSKELCGGPHVSSTKKIKHFKIVKQEAVGSGVRRIYGKVG